MKIGDDVLSHGLFSRADDAWRLMKGDVDGLLLCQFFHIQKDMVLFFHPLTWKSKDSINMYSFLQNPYVGSLSGAISVIAEQFIDSHSTLLIASTIVAQV